MSFARGLAFGKPDLPLGDTHVYFPVQIVPSLIEQFDHIGYAKCVPKDGLGYRPNRDPTREDNPYHSASLRKNANVLKQASLATYTKSCAGI